MYILKRSVDTVALKGNPINAAVGCITHRCLSANALMNVIMHQIRIPQYDWLIRSAIIYNIQWLYCSSGDMCV